ncbi:MAG: polysaccharide deacetylase, partial [Desulfovibrionaceae bacterium]
MSAKVRPLWLAPPRDWEGKLAKRLDQAANARAEVFFRADDAAVRSESFLRMLEIFERRKTPLDMAVVPAWLTALRAETLLRDTASDLFGLHQHGYRHVNHEARGKKCEFGPARPAAAKTR